MQRSGAPGWRQQSDTGMSAVSGCCCYRGNHSMFSLITDNRAHHSLSHTLTTPVRGALSSDCDELSGHCTTHPHTHRWRGVNRWKWNSPSKRPGGRDVLQGIRPAVCTWQTKPDAVAEELWHVWGGKGRRLANQWYCLQGDSRGPASDAINAPSDVIRHPEEIPSNDALGRDARSRLIGVSRITCHCLQCGPGQSLGAVWAICRTASSFYWLRCALLHFRHMPLEVDYTFLEWYGQ